MDAPNDTAQSTSFAPLKAMMRFKEGILKLSPIDSLMERGEVAKIDPVANNDSTDRNSDSLASNSDATFELPRSNPRTFRSYSIRPRSATAPTSSWGINTNLPRQPNPQSSYQQRVYQYGQKKILESLPLVHFEALEGTNILYLEQQLLHFENSLNSLHTGEAPLHLSYLGAILHQYADAIRDAEYMRDHVSGSIFLHMDELARNRNAFPEVPYASNRSLSKSIKETRPITYDALRLWLRDKLPTSMTVSPEEARRRVEVENELGVAPKDISPRVDKLARFIIAICGGFMLIIPMLMMRIHGDLVKSLVTTSISVVLFAAATSVVFEATDMNTLAATAAYTAVLVVFVGTNN